MGFNELLGCATYSIYLFEPVARYAGTNLDASYLMMTFNVEIFRHVMLDRRKGSIMPEFRRGAV